MITGISCPRRLNYLAKESLFSFAPFAWLLRCLGSIPIDRGGIGIAGMKETLRRLKKNESVVLFPEGERSYDGQMLPLMTGFCSLVKRVNVPLIPVGISGSHRAWPRTKQFPGFGRISVVIGEPIKPQHLQTLTEPEMIQLLSDRIRDCFEQACLINGQTAKESVFASIARN
jgi:1-acyl-sn-glycerol-3-phosphate acyltransferase